MARELARGPSRRSHRIARPLLIGQGANDPRVKQAESDQIVAAMEAKGIPVSYVLIPVTIWNSARSSSPVSGLQRGCA